LKSIASALDSSSEPSASFETDAAPLSSLPQDTTEEPIQLSSIPASASFIVVLRIKSVP
jgi:hypothetical protein